MITGEIASGDERLTLKTGLEADIVRLERLRATHAHDLFAVRCYIGDAERGIETAGRRIGENEQGGRKSSHAPSL